MNTPITAPSRREFLAGALIVGFSLRALPSLAQEGQNAAAKPPLPGSLKKAPMLEEERIRERVQRSQMYAGSTIGILDNDSICFNIPFFSFVMR